MTPDQMVQIHHAAFMHERGWSANEFRELLTQPYVTAFTAHGGFALVRTLAGETELLTLAVAPDHQRHGIAQGVLTEWINAVSHVAETAFLEVAADNHPALALYVKNGFTRSGLRKAYYARENATPADAIVMTRAFTQG